MFDILKMLEDKTTRQIFTIVGTILIIGAIAGVFYWEAGAIELWTPGSNTSNTPTPGVVNNTTGYWVRELDETGTTTVPSGPVGTPFSTITYTFNVKEEALECYVNLTSLSGNPREDLDLYVYDPQGNEYSSAGATADEQVHLKSKDMKRGGAGEWQIDIQTFTGGFMILPIQYQITADIFYNGTNGTANNTTTLMQKTANNLEFDNKVIVKIEFLAREN